MDLPFSCARMACLSPVYGLKWLKQHAYANSEQEEQGQRSLCGEKRFYFEFLGHLWLDRSFRGERALRRAWLHPLV